MGEKFEAWARREVVRLRAEADLLEALLSRYDGAPGQSVPSRDSVPGTRRNAPLMRAIAATGRDGLSLDGLMDAAGAAGLAPSRAKVRSFVWNQVRAGRLVATPSGNYALAEGRPAGAAPSGDAG